MGSSYAGAPGQQNSPSISGFFKNAWMGEPMRQIGSTENFDPLQRQGLNQFTNMRDMFDVGQNPLYQQAASALSGSPYMQNFDPTQYEKYFEQGVANPAMKMYEQQILPMISSRYSSPAGVHTSALNQAINSSASELQQGLGSLRANYLQQGQQSHAQNQLASIASALGLAGAPGQSMMNYYSQLFGAKPTTPMVQEAQSGWLKDLLQMAAQTGGEVAKGLAMAPKV